MPNKTTAQKHIFLELDWVHAEVDSALTAASSGTPQRVPPHTIENQFQTDIKVAKTGHDSVLGKRYGKGRLPNACFLIFKCGGSFSYAFNGKLTQCSTK